MRRSLATSLLALLLIVGTAGPAAANPPVPSPSPSPSAEVPPSAEPSAEPIVDPAASPSDSAEPSQSGDPSPAADPTATPLPDPTTTPGPTVEPDPTPVLEEGVADPTGRYLVILESGADTAGVVDRHRKRDGIKAERTFARAFRGFAGKLNGQQRKALLADPNVAAVIPDEKIELTAQTIPTGVSRVGTKSSGIAKIDGVDERVDADIAIVDTGVTAVSDLNVAGGYNCSTSDRSLWRDVHGHGTHVAGTAAALDNGIGVVGIAPGARIWGVKILNDSGEGLLSWYVCGLDWILAQRDPNDSSRPLIEAVNMSVTKWGKDDGACGSTINDVLHAAICRVTSGGITVVAAAANDSGSASKRVPASYNEVITVSALADTDGKSGALGGNRCWSWDGYDSDDTFANFSNYGGDVDLMAPGKCIWSTLPGNRYAYMSGTSMAAPTVTGAVALYKASRPMATPGEVKDALRHLGNLNYKTSTDPDGNPDILLDVSRLGTLGSFSMRSGTPTGNATDGGGVAPVVISIDRSSTYFERVRFSVNGLPSGWAASWAPSSIIGFTAESTTLNVTVPPGTKKGTYSMTVTASGLGQTRTQTVNVVVGPGSRWIGLSSPVRRLDTRSGIGLSGRFNSPTVRSFAVAGVSGIPADAVAVTGNLTVTEPTSAGYVTIGPSLTSRPSTSTINVVAGQTVANGVTVQLAAGRASAVFVGSSGASAHLLFDVTGYFRLGASGATWYGLSPTRFVDTRIGIGLTGDFTQGGVRTVAVAGRRGLPSNVVAVVGNVTITNATRTGFLSIGPSMTSSPSTSTVNFRAGQTIANNVTVRVGSGGTVQAVVNGSTGVRADVLFDVTGYFLSGDDGAHWYPVAPVRRLDTRVATGLSGRFQDGRPRSFQVTGGSIPTTAKAVTANLTATEPTGSGFVAGGPTMVANPNSSTLNVRPGQTVPNGLVLQVTSGGRAAAVYQGSSGSSTHLLLDVVGYFR